MECADRRRVAREPRPDRARVEVGGVIVAVLVLLVGVPFMWLIDIITVLMKNTVWWFD